MKVEQLNSQQIDWTKPQVVVHKDGTRIQLATNIKAGDLDCFCGVEIETGKSSEYWIKKDFKLENATSYPIEIKLTIESDEELCDLMYRININANAINNNINGDLKYKADYKSSAKLFECLEILTKERNLYKND